jgi:hypothetical protein
MIGNEMEIEQKLPPIERVREQLTSIRRFCLEARKAEQRGEHEDAKIYLVGARIVRSVMPNAIFSPKELSNMNVEIGLTQAYFNELRILNASALESYELAEEVVE